MQRKHVATVMIVCVVVLASAAGIAVVISSGAPIASENPGEFAGRSGKTGERRSTGSSKEITPAVSQQSRYREPGQHGKDEGDQPKTDVKQNGRDITYKGINPRSISYREFMEVIWPTNEIRSYPHEDLVPEEFLLELARNVEDRRIRYRAILILYVEWYDCRKIIPTLKEMLKSEDTDDRLVAAVTLKMECRDNSYLSLPTDVLAEALKTEAAERLSEEYDWPIDSMTIIDIIADKGDKEALTALAMFLRKTDYPIAVAEVMAKLGDNSGYEAAISARQPGLRKGDGSLDMDVVDDLIRLKDRNVFRELQSDLYDLTSASQPNYKMIGQVMDQLKRSRDETTVAILADVFSKTQDKWVRQRVLDALGRIGTPKAKEALKAIDTPEARQLLQSIGE